jgi:hypothetical protein
MERLVDSKETQAEAREVLTLARPAAVTRARMQRVRWSLDQRARANPLSSLPLLAAAAFLLLGAGALAALGSGLLTNRTENGVMTPAAVAPAKPKVLAPRAADAEKPASPGVERAVEPQDPALDGAPPSPHKERPLSPARPSSAVLNADVERVHNAAAALRREGDPAKAAKLLESINSQKSGPLAEEALALRIEAAMSQRDPRAREFATAYLGRYPTGRYVAVAREALRSPPR